MSRRRRKIKANKEYDKELNKKKLSILDVSINTALETTKLLLDYNPSTPTRIFIVTEMAREKQKLIISQPLPITKPNKYGKYKDYRFDGEIVGIEKV